MSVLAQRVATAVVVLAAFLLAVFLLPPRAFALIDKACSGHPDMWAERSEGKPRANRVRFLGGVSLGTVLGGHHEAQCHEALCYARVVVWRGLRQRT